MDPPSVSVGESPSEWLRQQALRVTARLEPPPSAAAPPGRLDQLDAGSPRASPPPGCLVDLWPHQLALLHACQRVEASSSSSGPVMGALVDRPGAGKTNVVLALALLDASARGPGQPARTTVVIVPHNILSQWQRAARAMSPGLRVATFASYEHVAALLHCPSELLSRHDVVLSTSLYFHSIATALLSSSAHRLVLDEVDSIAGVMPSRLPARATWFVSATAVESFLGGARSAYGRTSAAAARVGCAAAFVDAGVPLPAPVSLRVVLANLHIDHVLSGVVSDRDLGALNAVSYGSLALTRAAKVVATSTAEVIDALLKGGRLEAERQRDLAAELERTVAGADADADAAAAFAFLGPDVHEGREQLKRLRLVADALREQLDDARRSREQHEARVATVERRLAENDCCLVCYDPLVASAGRVITSCCRNAFCKPCMATWLGIARTCPTCRAVLKDVVELRPPPPAPVAPPPPPPPPPPADAADGDDGLQAMHAMQAAPDKVAALEALLADAGAGGRRVIVFSDYDDSFKPVVAMLRRTGTRHVELDGGSVRALDEAQLAFVSGRAPVLLVNSAFYSAGMNLECASDVVFMHSMAAATEKQVVGRAQRPGRVGRLRVWQLLYANETNSLFSRDAE